MNVKQILLRKSGILHHAKLALMISVECQTAWMSTVDAGCQTDTVEEVSQLSPHSLCQNEEKFKFYTGNGFVLLQ